MDHHSVAMGDAAAVNGSRPNARQVKLDAASMQSFQVDPEIGYKATPSRGGSKSLRRVYVTSPSMSGFDPPSLMDANNESDLSVCEESSSGDDLEASNTEPLLRTNEIPVATVKSSRRRKEAARAVHSQSTAPPRVLGVEIGGFTPLQQYLILTTVLFFFTLVYGYLQELVSIHIFKRKFGLFVTLIQFVGYTGFASLQWAGRANRLNKLPLVYLVMLAILQASMQGLSNLSMQYLNYPAKVLFKSSRVLPTMIFGVCFYGKRYSTREYITILILVIGLVIFMGADASSPEFNAIGVFLICTSLVVDACIINLQEHLFRVYQCDEEEMVFNSYAGGSLVLFLICLCTGEMNQGVEFLNTNQNLASVFAIMLLFSACGFCGVSCVAGLTKSFGALTASITTTARKALSLVLSFIFFPKPILPGHILGIILFVYGLGMKAHSRARAHGQRDNSPHETSTTTLEPVATALDGQVKDSTSLNRPAIAVKIRDEDEETMYSSESGDDTTTSFWGSQRSSSSMRVPDGAVHRTTQQCTDEQ